MNNSVEMKAVLTSMQTLLMRGECSEWAKGLEMLAERIEADGPSVHAEVKALFGGMGSLNDIVLYADGQPLAAENIEFDTLRTRLYELVTGP